MQWKKSARLTSPSRSKKTSPSAVSTCCQSPENKELKYPSGTTVKVAREVVYLKPPTFSLMRPCVASAALRRNVLSACALAVSLFSCSFLDACSALICFCDHEAFRVCPAPQHEQAQGQRRFCRSSFWKRVLYLAFAICMAKYV